MVLRRFAAVACAAALVVAPGVASGLVGAASAGVGAVRKAAQPSFPYRLVPTPGQDLELVVPNLGFRDCLDLENMTGSYVLHWQCHSQTNQRWRFVDAGDGYWAIKPLGFPADCVDVEGVTGPYVVRWPCHGGANQSWDIWVVTTNAARVSPRSNRATCLDATFPDARVVVLPCDDRKSTQAWGIAR
ncbi:ricin-type beta-trefoil lectin domain protein [Actinosynnema sp. NPDC050436]|uniref:RICIN domain-containing protein n=1 Tax=Actinosynnema sp. NPDC050436 TaxID=3155659 RepID=UPI0033CAEA70